MRLERLQRRRTLMLALAAAGLVALTAGAAFAGSGACGHAAAQERAKQTVEDDYPLGTCIVSGAKLGSMGEPVVYDYEGREIRFCCAGCVKPFEADPEAYLAKMDEAIIAAEGSDYPLETCVVSGRKLGSKGEPVDHVYDNHLVRLCSAGCVKSFEKDPARYMAEVEKARAAAPKPYPMDTCIVSGAKLGSMGDPVTVVHDGREVKFCCAGCAARFESDPGKYMQKLEGAGAEKDAPRGHRSCGGHAR